MLIRFTNSGSVSRGTTRNTDSSFSITIREVASSRHFGPAREFHRVAETRHTDAEKLIEKIHGVLAARADNTQTGKLRDKRPVRREREFICRKFPASVIAHVLWFLSGCVVKREKTRNSERFSLN